MKLVDNKTFTSLSAEQRALMFWLAECPCAIKELTKYEYLKKIEITIGFKGTPDE